MSDPKRELAAVITARYSSFDGLSALGIAAAIVEAGWVDPDTHAGMWRRQYARANAADAKLARVEALAGQWEEWAVRRSTTRIDAFRDAAEALRAALADPEGGDSDAQ